MKSHAVPVLVADEAAVRVALKGGIQVAFMRRTAANVADRRSKIWYVTDGRAATSRIGVSRR